MTARNDWVDFADGRVRRRDNKVAGPVHVGEFRIDGLHYQQVFIRFVEPAEGLAPAESFTRTSEVTLDYDSDGQLMGVTIDALEVKP